MTTFSASTGYASHIPTTHPYARFHDPVMAPLPAHVREALALGPVSPDQLPGRDSAPDLLNPGYGPRETGYALCPDGSARVFVLTDMPGVTPAMWDWWFGWHGCDPQRYRLWHPQAHVQARWSDGLSDEDRYIGRTSNVVEYIGTRRRRFSIRFIPPRRGRTGRIPPRRPRRSGDLRPRRAHRPAGGRQLDDPPAAPGARRL